MITNEQKKSVLDAVTTASLQWRSSFNSGNAEACAAQYENTAIMHARPFGRFTGIVEIQEFWQKLIDEGYTDVEYLDPQIDVIDEASAILTAGWKMNKASGVIHKEFWVLQEDGTAKLREDDFEAKG